MDPENFLTGWDWPMEKICGTGQADEKIWPDIKFKISNYGKRKKSVKNFQWT